MANKWFETVAEAQRRAQKRLPKSVYGALLAGSERGLTVADNVQAFAELGFAPHVAGLSSKRDLATTVMGQPVSLPVIISPTGVQAVHPDGEVAVARAAAARGTAMGLSSFASKPIEEVAAANPQTFFQMYWVGTREVLVQRMERARQAGAAGLIVTLDWSFSNGRDWGSPVIPEKVDLQAMARFAPEAVIRPGWLWQYAKTRRVPDLTTPNLARPGEAAPTFFGAYGEWMQTPLPTWDDVAWLREQWGGPFMLKGITRVDDARRAVQAGVTAISVSNHGGNNLDGTPATIRVLPAIADAVGDQVEGLLDRPRLPVGPGRQRPGRGGERARHPARRDRLGGAGPGPLHRPRPEPRRRGGAPRLHPRPGHHRPAAALSSSPARSSGPRRVTRTGWGRPRARRAPQDLRMLTARAMTSAPIASDTADCTSMVSLAHLASGITSVGLNAVALVNDR
jgi:pre-mycofactocin synthase